jgi:hypothetical protein
VWPCRYASAGATKNPARLDRSWRCKGQEPQHASCHHTSTVTLRSLSTTRQSACPSSAARDCPANNPNAARSPVRLGKLHRRHAFTGTALEPTEWTALGPDPQVLSRRSAPEGEEVSIFTRVPARCLQNVRFWSRVCQVVCRNLGPTWQRSLQWNQWLKCQLSGLSGFYDKRGVWRNRKKIEVAERRLEPASILDSSWTPRASNVRLRECGNGAPHINIC